MNTWAGIPGIIGTPSIPAIVDLHSNFRRVVRLIGALVDQTVGGNMHHSAVEPRHAALVVGQQSHIGAQSGTDHIDVFGPDTRNHDEPILPGNQIHERCAGGQ